MDSPAAPAPKETFPRVFWSANVTELFERAAYYAMASFVVLYLGQLGAGKYWPSNLNGFLWTLVYFLPVLSGTIADQVGFKRSLLAAFILLAAGYFLMGYPVWLGGNRLAGSTTSNIVVESSIVTILCVVTFLVALCILGWLAWFVLGLTVKRLGTWLRAFISLVLSFGSVFILIKCFPNQIGERGMYLKALSLIEVFQSQEGIHIVLPVLMGIILIGMGGSVIKPCISGTVQKTAGARATLGFGIFYMVINVGSLVGRAVSYFFRTQFDLSFIFLVAAGCSVIAFFVVLFFYHEPAADKLSTTAITAKPRRSVGRILLDMIIVLKNLRFTVFLILISGFFFIYNQVYNVLPLYLKTVVETNPPVDIYTMANPLVIVLFQLIITRAFGKLKPIRSIIVGIVIIGLSMLINIIPILLMNIRGAYPGVLFHLETAMCLCGVILLLGKVSWARLVGGGLLAAGVLGFCLTYFLNPSFSGMVFLKLIPSGAFFITTTVALIAFGELFTSARMYEYIGALAPKGQEGLFLGYANLPLAIGALVGGPVGAFIFNEIMCRNHKVLPNGLFELDPWQNAFGWLILMGVGFLSAVSMWAYNRWLERHPA